jgi:Uma2 family endonuclease
MLEVFRSLPEGTLVQLIENRLIMSPSPKDLHQKYLLELAAQLLAYVRSKKLGEVRIAPYDVYLDKRNVYQPDLLFISTENLYKIEENGLHGAPDLVIEVLSPRTATYDRGKKKAVYERCGVKEYWIVDPVTKAATGYSLQENRFVELAAATGVIDSLLLNTPLPF